MPNPQCTPFAIACKAKGVTTEEVAKQLGLSRSYIYKIVHGERTPSLKNAARLSALLNVPLEDLFPDIFLSAMPRKVADKNKPEVA
jgi:transcriptional regulator with XRE-family HTH domain